MKAIAKEAKTIVGGTGKSGRAAPVVIYRRVYPSIRLIGRELRSRGTYLVSNSTVRRDLRKEGLVAKRKPRGPQRRLPDAETRLKFCKRMLRSPPSSIIFSDESMFDVNNCGCATEWCAKEEPAHEREYYGFAPKLHVWGAIAEDFIRIIFLPERALDSADYNRLVLQPLQKELGPGLGGRLFVQDNAKVHRANDEYLKRKNIDCVQWPARSPDLNPVEMLWAILKRKIADRGPIDSTQLREFVEAEIAKITKDTINKLVNTFRRRLRACIKKKGATVTAGDHREFKV